MKHGKVTIEGDGTPDVTRVRDEDGQALRGIQVIGLSLALNDDVAQLLVMVDGQGEIENFVAPVDVRLERCEVTVVKAAPGTATQVMQSV
jgi:hypothetical protein